MKDLLRDISTKVIVSVISAAIIAAILAVWGAINQEDMLLGVLLFLICFVALIWAINGIIWLLNQNNNSASKLPQKYEYGLSPVRLDFGIIPEKDKQDLVSVSVHLILANTTNLPLRYYIESFRIEIGGRTTSDPKYLNRGAVIFPLAQKMYSFRAIDEVTLPIGVEVEGTFECVIRYGHPDHGIFREAKRRSKIIMNRAAINIHPQIQGVAQELVECKDHLISESDKKYVGGFPKANDE